MTPEERLAAAIKRALALPVLRWPGGWSAMTYPTRAEEA